MDNSTISQQIFSSGHRIHNNCKMSQDLVHLNVGGYKYTTTKNTLSRYPNSMLGAMFNGSMPTSVDEEGR